MMTAALRSDGKAPDSWELVSAVQQGDGATFGAIYRRYAPFLLAYFVSRNLDRGTAEDLTSETFVRAYQAIAGVTNQGKDLGSWLIAIARNLVRDHFKSSRFRHETAVADLFQLSRSVDGPEGKVLASLALDELSTKLSELTSEQRECLLLRRVHGYSVDETAAKMQRSAGAVRALQHRAGRHLKEILEGDAG
jgi:RNA polymerase sigma-70 factor (ECF subfamily)